MQLSKIVIVQPGKIKLTPLDGCGSSIATNEAFFAIQQCEDKDLKGLLDQIETNKFLEDTNLRKEFIKVLVGRLLGAKIVHDDSLAIRDLIFSTMEKISADELFEARNIAAEIVKDSVEKFGFGDFQPGCIRPSVQSAIINWRDSITPDYWCAQLTPLLLLPQLSFKEYLLLTNDSNEVGINVYRMGQSGYLSITNGIDEVDSLTPNRVELEVFSSTASHTHGYEQCIPSRDDLVGTLRHVGILRQDWILTSINPREKKLGCVAFFQSDVGDFVRTTISKLVDEMRIPQKYLKFFYDKILRDEDNFDWDRIEDLKEVLSKLKYVGIVHPEEVL